MNLVDIFTNSEDTLIATCSLKIYEHVVWKGNLDQEGFLNILEYKEDKLISGTPTRYQVEKTRPEEVPLHDFAKLTMRRHVEMNTGLAVDTASYIEGWQKMAEQLRHTQPIQPMQTNRDPFNFPIDQYGTTTNFQLSNFSSGNSIEQIHTQNSRTFDISYATNEGLRKQKRRDDS